RPKQAERPLFTQTPARQHHNQGGPPSEPREQNPLAPPTAAGGPVHCPGPPRACEHVHPDLPPRRGAVPAPSGVPAPGSVPLPAGVLVPSGGGVAAGRAFTRAVRSASCWASPASASRASTAAFAPCAGVMLEVPMGALSSAATPFLTRSRISLLVGPAFSCAATPFFTRSRISFFVYGISSPGCQLSSYTIDSS